MLKSAEKEITDTDIKSSLRKDEIAYLIVYLRIREVSAGIA